MDNLDLSQVTSLDQLYKIRGYWVQRQIEVKARTEQAKAQIIQEIEAIRRDTLNMEASLDLNNQQTTSAVQQPTCSSTKIMEQLDLPIRQLDQNARIYQSSDRTEETISGYAKCNIGKRYIRYTEREDNLYTIPALSQ